MGSKNHAAAVTASQAAAVGWQPGGMYAFARGLVIGALVLASACSKDSESSTPSSGAANTASATPDRAAPAEEVSEPERSPLEELLAIEDFATALERVKPLMTDTFDDISPGAAMLGIWGSRHMHWTDVAVTKNETSFALVRKDADAARGKRICLRGRIIQIAKEKLDEGAIFSGLMLTGYSQITRFIAVGSTGELVERSGARYCGVVIGTYDYKNSGGGTGHAVSMVGMFDLPENRAAAGMK